MIINVTVFFFFTMNDKDMFELFFIHTSYVNEITHGLYIRPPRRTLSPL